MKKKIIIRDCIETLVSPLGSILAAGGFNASRSQTSGGGGVISHPMADYRRLSCPSCGRSYKYRGGLLRHMTECFSESEKLEAVASVVQQQQQRPVTPKDVRVLYKFWKPD